MSVPRNIELYRSLGYVVTKEEMVKNRNGNSLPIVTMEKDFPIRRSLIEKKLGCLHAHHSNIEYIEQAFGDNEDIELMHFVDHGVIQHVSKGSNGLALKVKEQIEWIISCDVDAILITCTNYIALLEDETLFDPSIPIIKIDEPYFESICSKQQPQFILLQILRLSKERWQDFTNMLSIKEYQ